MHTDFNASGYREPFHQGVPFHIMVMVRRWDSVPEVPYQRDTGIDKIGTTRSTRCCACRVVPDVHAYSCFPRQITIVLFAIEKTPQSDAFFCFCVQYMQMQVVSPKGQK